MAKKPVVIQGRKFDAVGEANEYFKQMGIPMFDNETVTHLGDRR